jgi:type VI secretion system protein ImpE
MTAKEFFDAGRVRDGANSLAAHLRDHPSDTKARTFLFELLCFAGEFDRAEKQLNILSGADDLDLAAAHYHAALRAERQRHEIFRTQNFPKTGTGVSRPGLLNGKPFASIRDQDPQIGANLEVFAAGTYLWVPFEQLQSIQLQAARRLRERLWAPAVVIATPEFRESELGAVLIPAIYPFSWKLEDETVWLGRRTEWAEDDEGQEFPVGQKMFIADDGEVALFEIQTIEFADSEGALDASA